MHTCSLCAAKASRRGYVFVFSLFDLFFGFGLAACVLRKHRRVVRLQVSGVRALAARHRSGPVGRVGLDGVPQVDRNRLATMLQDPGQTGNLRNGREADIGQAQPVPVEGDAHEEQDDTLVGRVWGLCG